MATPRRPDPRNQRVRCSAKSVLRDAEGHPVLDADGRKQYKPCRNWARKGQEVCRSHGGNTSQALIKAEEQLRRARDPLMAEMLEIAFDRRLPVADRYKALAWALERSGFKPGMAVELETPPWQQALHDLFAGKYDEPEPVKVEATTGPPERSVQHQGLVPWSEEKIKAVEESIRIGDDLLANLNGDRKQAGAYGEPVTGEVYDRSGTRIGRARMS